jgi:hypothetical protein
MHIQKLFEQKREKDYLLDRIGSAHPEAAPRRERIAPVTSGA